MKIKICLLLLFSSYVGFTQQPYLKNLDGLRNKKNIQKRDSLVLYNLYTLSKIITPKQEFWVDSLKRFSVKENSKIGFILWQLMNDEKEIRKLNYAHGVQKHLENAKLLEKNNYHSYASWPYLRAGILFARVSSDIVNKKNALDYYEKGLSLAISTKDTSEIIRAYDYIGEYYLDTKQLPKAIENLEKAIALLEKAEDKNLYPTVLASLGSCYLLKKNEKKANEYYKKMNERLTNSGFKFADFYEGYIQNIYYYGLGLYYFNEKRYDKVIPFATKGYEALKGFQKKKNSRTFTTYALDHLKLLVESYEKLHEFEKAFQTQKKYNELKNSTLEAELESKLHDLNEKYKTEQKEITITKLENENLKNQTSKRNQLILFLSLLLVLGSGSIFFVSKKNKQLVLKNNELNLKNKEITEALLKGQTIERQRVAADLHDNLGSTLSALWMGLDNVDQSKLNEVEKEIHEEIRSNLEKAYNDVRLLSHNLLPNEFEKQGLVMTLHNFVQKLNKNSKISFKLNVSENFRRADKKIEFELYCICLELVTNIQKHSQATKALIELFQDEKNIVLSCKDNGIGFQENTTNEGIGMKNIHARIASINGSYHSDNTLGTSIEISVPSNYKS